MRATSLLTGASAPGQLRRRSERRLGDLVGLVVADRITADGRGYLTRTGWTWLDLRGHMRLVGAGVLVDAAVPVL